MNLHTRLTFGPVLIVVVAIGWLAPPGVTQADEKAARAAETTRLQPRVDQAIERGARWLKRRRGRKADYGSLPREGALHEYPFPAGLTAFAYFTLVSVGVKPEDSGLKAIYRRLRRRHRRPITTYESSVLLMAIDARYSPTATGRPRAAVTPTRAGRDPRRAPEDCLYSREDWKWAAELARFLVRAQHSGGWRYYLNNESLSFDRDVSATVFVLLGLVRVSRAGYAVPPRVFQDASRFLCDLQEQHPDRTSPEGGLARGFPYGTGRSREAVFVSGGTTAAGLASLHLCRAECRRLGVDPDPRVQSAIRDAEAWLDQHWQVDRNPKAHHYLYCYLYALERIGSLTGRETIGRHPWYLEGARFLLEEQDPKTGKWDDTSCCAPTDVLGTCFALLFLKRATRAVTESPPPIPPEKKEKPEKQEKK